MKAALHKEMLSRIADLETLMAVKLPITDQDFLDIKTAIARLKVQPPVDPIPVGDAIKARTAASTLVKIAHKFVANISWQAILHIKLMRLANSAYEWLGSERQWA